jgi:hypothetical protein
MTVMKKVLFLDPYDEDLIKLAWGEPKLYDLHILAMSDIEKVEAEYKQVLSDYELRPKMYALDSRLPQRLSGKIQKLSKSDFLEMLDPDNF